MICNSTHIRIMLYPRVTDHPAAARLKGRGEMTETVDAGLRQSREATALAHIEAESRQRPRGDARDIQIRLQHERSCPARLLMVHDAVADWYRELFTAFPDVRFDIKPGSLCHHGDQVIVRG